MIDLSTKESIENQLEHQRNDPIDNRRVEPIQCNVSFNLVDFIQTHFKDITNELSKYIGPIEAEYGIKVPKVRYRDNLALKDNFIEILIYDKICLRYDSTSDDDFLKTLVYCLKECISINKAMFKDGD